MNRPAGTAAWSIHGIGIDGELLAQHDAANRCSRMLSTDMAPRDWPEGRRITECPCGNTNEHPFRR